jgi:hypothetical protein
MMDAALVIGVNYSKGPAASRLNGCINDAMNVNTYLVENMAWNAQNIIVCTDDDASNGISTSREGILASMTELARRSWRDGGLRTAWISYSGHGSWLYDDANDERDSRDECLIPSDYETAGVITDDELKAILQSFNPKTWVVCVIDACHSATMGDLKFLWHNFTRNSTGRKKPVFSIEGRSTNAARIIMISGCRDDSVSADAWFQNTRRFEGALTNALITTLKKSPKLSGNIFALLNDVQFLIDSRGFAQLTQLSSSVNLTLMNVSQSLWPQTLLKSRQQASWKTVVSRAFDMAALKH